MSKYKQYRRKQIAELADWQPGFDMTGVSVSDTDKQNGSPKAGDKIARNPANHNDRWLIAAEYFATNFAPISAEHDAQSVRVTDAMVNRFLSWPLPKTFAPDCFINFDREASARNPHVWPIGTNLLTADEARQMLEYVLVPEGKENG